MQEIFNKEYKKVVILRAVKDIHSNDNLREFTKGCNYMFTYKGVNTYGTISDLDRIKESGTTMSYIPYDMIKENFEFVE